MRIVRLPTIVSSPLCDLLESVEEENALALRLSNGFHDPHRIITLLKFFHEDVVVDWQIISQRVETHPEDQNTLTVPLHRLCLPSREPSCGVSNS